MTLQGTNTYVISAPNADTAVIVDPGEEAVQEDQLAAIRDFLGEKTVELILVTHHHHDHTGAVNAFHQAFGAPVRAGLDQWCRGGGEKLTDGETISAGGTQIQVVHTPGHTSDHFCFFIADDGAGSVLTGDTILGSGTTMLDFPDGKLGDYLMSLDVLEALETDEAVTVLPAHGPKLDSVASIAAQYRAHRLSRVEQMEQLLGGAENVETPVHNDSAQVKELAEKLYGDVPVEVRVPAQRTMAATLEFLAETAHSPAP